jgi:small subunit ribosomal protein S7e
MDAHSKLVPSCVANASALELTVAKALFDIQSTNSDLAGDLRLLQIRGAREVELSGGRKAVVVLVPVPQLKGWRRVQSRVLRELEKKLGAGGERSILLVAFRRIVAKPKRTEKTMRPRSRTLTAVHEAWLEDMVYPTEVVGKRIRVKTDGSRLMKVLLDPKDQTTLEGKTEVMAAVYRKLTGKDVVFEFPAAMVQEEEPRRK